MILKVAPGCISALFIVLVIMAAGCMEDNKRRTDIISEVQITHISASSSGGEVKEMTIYLYVNGTTDIEMETIEFRLNIPASMGKPSLVLKFGYNASDPWSASFSEYLVLDPPDTSRDLPLVLAGREQTTLLFDLSSEGSFTADTTSILEVGWGEGYFREYALQVPELIPTDGTFEIEVSGL